jgi:hypothetical protein
MRLAALKGRIRAEVMSRAGTTRKSRIVRTRARATQRALMRRVYRNDRWPHRSGAAVRDQRAVRVGSSTLAAAGAWAGAGASCDMDVSASCSRALSAALWV